jgi:2-furoyl-CoA dehydrogenase large subunit
VGRPLERLEDAALLTGRGRYADDLGVKPGTLHAAIPRSPHAYASVNAIDVSRAERSGGVRAVLTREDVSIIRAVLEVASARRMTRQETVHA